MFENFFNSDIPNDRPIRSLNNIIMQVEKANKQMFLKSKKSELDKGIQQKLQLDVEYIFKQMQPDENLRPQMSRIDFIGMAGMGLVDNGSPAKVQINIKHNYIKAFKDCILEYVKARYSHLQVRSYRSYEELINDAEGLNNSGNDLVSADSSGTENDEQL